MHKATFKRVVFLITILTVLILYGCGKYEEHKSTPPIFEIANTKIVFNYPDSKDATMERHYMIVTPPEDLEKLKAMVEKFHNENPIDKDMMIKNKTNHIELYFYRVSKKLSINWQPNEGYLNTDRIEHHKDDCIATIRYSESSSSIYYSVMKKSRNKDNYGKYMEGIEYEGDKIVNRRGEDGKYK